ncbi:sensor histidine kinase, partial [Erwinia billingiae]|nr:sensor histidine kinase [Erwinia billingiae]
MRFFRPSLIIYLILSILFTVAVVVTIDKFNGIKDQYASMEPNLDNYSTAEILFLAFERTRTAAY